MTVTLSPPTWDVDFDELLPRGSYGMPILQGLGLQGAGIENLFGIEKGFLGGIESYGEGQRQGCHQWG